MLLETLLSALEIRLVCIVEDNIAVGVELLLKLHTETEDAPLVMLGFSVDENVCAAVLDFLGDFVARVDKLLGKLGVVVKGFADYRSSTSLNVVAPLAFICGRGLNAVSLFLTCLGIKDSFLCKSCASAPVSPAQNCL
ncbi:hypothetical protein HG531_009124 [Fusarium graminearum]|nr:hypothetical protein HG531_009124 [Fusarium graminearum]